MSSWTDARGRVAAMHQMGSGAVVIEFTDGRVVAHPSLGTPFAETSRVASTTVRPNDNRIIVATTLGDEIVVELPTAADLAPVGGRPVIYLDQKDWSTLANARFAPERVSSPAERDAAHELIRLATDRKVILPMSAGHLQETTQWSDAQRRYWLGLTVAQLSAGWQLRDPIDVRRRELVAALISRYRVVAPAPVETVTLEPGAWNASTATAPASAATDLGPQALWDLEVVTGVHSVIDVLLDEEHTPAGEVPGWAPQFESFAAFLASDARGPALKRRRTHAKFIADLGLELPVAAWLACITPAQMTDWTLHRSEEDLEASPSLGLYRELLHEKLCDPRRRWVQNDLTDMMYLGAAAGYCDHVVGERAHIRVLGSAAHRLGRDLSLHSGLVSLVEQL